MTVADQGGDATDDPTTVVVPVRPGPVLRLRAAGPGRRRGRDDLDELIDDLLPDVEDGPGRADAALVIAGAALVAWGTVGSGPPAALVGGAVAVGLGCVLPARSLWRAAGRRRRQRRRRALLGAGVALDVSTRAPARLVAAYELLLDRTGRLDPDIAGASVAAAHGALSEVASLLSGRPPSPGRELDYVEERAVAIERLAAALAPAPGEGVAAPGEASPAGTATVVDARDELDGLTGASTVTRLDDLAAEARARDGHRG
jgi:hypothetical protein